jgi:hypothetical protein
MASLNPHLRPVNSYDFHTLTGMPQHRVVIRIEEVEPPSAVHGPLPLDIGDLDNDLPNIHYEFKLNAGRVGHPGAEIRFFLPVVAGFVEKELRLAIEPGVAARGGKSQYHLQTLEAKFQGRPGGAGRTNRGDIPALRDERDVPRKKRILKAKITAHGVVPFPDSFAVNSMLSDNRTPLAARAAIQMLLNASTIKMRVYVLVPQGRQDEVMNRTVDPFQSILLQRLPPMYQYTTPQNLLTLDMEGYGDFQDKMYCSPSRANPKERDPPSLTMPGTQSRREARPVAIAHTVGLIREFQGLGRIVLQLGNASQRLRIVRTTLPIFSTHTRSLANAVPSPTDAHCYLAYVNSASAPSRTRTTPMPGTVFNITKQDGSNTHGVVLDLPGSFLQVANASFVMILVGVPEAIKRDAKLGRNLATTESADLGVLKNRSIWEIQLESMLQLSKKSREPSVRAIQDVFVFQPNRLDIFTTDLRHNASIWEAALPEVRSYLLSNDTLSRGEDELLTRVPQVMPSTIRLLQTNVKDVRFRSVLALACLFSRVALPVILVSDAPEDRARIARTLRTMMTAPLNSQAWASKVLLAYTSSELDHGDDPSCVPLRMAIDLATRSIDDFPHHSFLTEEDPSHFNSASNVSPPDGIPLDTSMGCGIQRMLVNAAPQDRQQYFLDRQQVIDGTFPLNIARLEAALRRRNAIELQVIQRADVIVTNYVTATSDKVRLEKPNAVLIFTDAHAVQLTPLASVVHRYPKHHAAFVCGDTGNSQHPLALGSRGQNEAHVSTDWTAWEVMVRAQMKVHLLG